MSQYLIKTNDKSSYIIIITADKSNININIQNTEKLTNSYYEGDFKFNKLIQTDEYFKNFENNFSLYKYFNFIFSNNKVNFIYEKNELSMIIKFKVNERLKEITFPLMKRNINKEQSLLINEILIKFVTKLQDNIKLKDEKINALRLDKKDTKKIKIESKIINNKELKVIIEKIKEENEKDDADIQFKILFSVNVYEQNIINQLIDFSDQYDKQCLSIIEFESQKICIIFTHQNTGNYCLIINENETKKYFIKDFYIDKDKFCFKLYKSDNEEKIYIKNYYVKEFIQMEFFSITLL